MSHDRIGFAYLYYTTNYQGMSTLVGVFRSQRAAKSHLKLVNGEDVPCSSGNRIAQKINKTTGQIWYVEKHVFKNPM